MSFIYRLQCETQSYDWGKLGDTSKVAAYAKASGLSTDNNTPYAELWMGTHPNAPSVILQDKTSLRQLIKDRVELSTQKVYDQYETDLPFLFKILSIRKALSIQAHPDKALGSRLFKDFPQNYKDPNHKASYPFPEMAIALTPFEALCAFRPLEEISQHIKEYPELAELIGQQITTEFLSTASSDKSVQEKKAVLKKVFSAVMNSSQAVITDLLTKMIERIRNDDSLISQLLVRLDQQYPGGDVGVFSCLLLNYVTMEPGQAIFLDCVECMAASDNVVRAGLTPKFKDVDVLVDMLTYRYGSAESQKMTPVPFGDHSLLYDPPIDEFAVIWANLKGALTETHSPVEGPSVLIVTRGSGQLIDKDATYDLQEGYVYFVGANTPLVAQSNNEGLEFYRAYAVSTL